MRHTRFTLALAAAAAIAAGATVSSKAIAAEGAEPGPPLADPAAPVPAVAAASPVKVMVLPFAPVANADRDAWIGRAIAEALTADLSIDRTLRVSTDKSQSVDNIDNALVAAKLAGVQVVVYGTTQNVGENVRVVGQIVDVESGKPLAGIKATGPLQELFSLQDSLVHQIEIRLGRPGLPVPPPQPPAADSPLPLPGNHDDGVLGIPRPTERRGIPWLDEENARSDEFLRDMKRAHDDYNDNYPSPWLYYGSPVYSAPIWGVPIGAVPVAPGTYMPPGWRRATPNYYPFGYYPYGYFPDYYYPPVTVRVTATDGDGWNGRTQTQGSGMVGGGQRATSKVQPYQLAPGQRYYQSASNGNTSTATQRNVPQAVTHQVGNRQMPVSNLPDSPEVAARRAAGSSAASSSVSSTPNAGARRQLRMRPPPRRPTPAPPPVVNQQQPQQQNSQPGQTARR